MRASCMRVGVTFLCGQLSEKKFVGSKKILGMILSRAYHSSVATGCACRTNERKDRQMKDLEDMAQEIEERYREMLDEHYSVTIFGYDYPASRVLDCVDHIAYRQGLLDYADSLISDGEYPDEVNDYL